MGERFQKVLGHHARGRENRAVNRREHRRQQRHQKHDRQPRTQKRLRQSRQDRPLNIRREFHVGQESQAQRESCRTTNTPSPQ